MRPILSRRLDKLESMILPGEWPVCDNIIDRLLSDERNELLDALVRIKDDDGSEEDRRTVGRLFALGRERLDAGVIVVRERRDREEINADLRAFRAEHGVIGWGYICFYNEYLAVHEQGHPSGGECAG